ncbi:replicative DNA helicase [Salegentibacter mishustinae]|uniref:replicative DNA helicase n=1 Tax=Salegentibacter mishustinae TaxID=270918 RepID=UPI0024905993|nr:replicative DNA helicase [Salegentibacter mishustinae]
MSTNYILPRAVDLEEAIIGAILIDENCLLKIADILKPGMFYTKKFQHLFGLLLDMYSSGIQIDILTVSNKLKQLEGDSEEKTTQELINLTNKIFSGAHIETHAHIIIQKYIQRELIKNSQSLMSKCYEDKHDVFDLLNESYNLLNTVSEESIRKREVNFNDLVGNQIRRGVDIFNNKIKSGLSTPIRKLSQKTGGWRNGELIILAARPGMGKTAFALSIALTTAKNQIGVAFFSLEMSKEQLTNRILSMLGKIDNQKFNISGLDPADEKKMNSLKKDLKNLPLVIDDSASLTIEELQIKAKRNRANHNIGLIVVDYLQLMTGKAQSREQEISKISRGLKMIAKDLDIPVIALSQLSRAVESRGGSKRPMLSDLRESGAIEQDADAVIFLYRPEYYNIDFWGDEYQNAMTRDEAEYIVAKNRNGGLIRGRMAFEGKYTLFSNLEEAITFN